MSFYQATFRIGSFAGIFTTGTLSGIWIERKRQSENVEQLFKPDIDSSIVTHKVEIIDPKIERAKSILKYGAPQSLSPGTLYHENHVLEFDPIRKTPLWVAEHIPFPFISFHPLALSVYLYHFNCSVHEGQKGH